MKTSKCWIFLALLTGVFSGCTGDPVRISSIVDLKNVDLTRGRPIYSEAGGFQLYWMIPINTNSRQARAYRELLQMAAGDVIADLKVTERWAYGYIGTTYWTQMEAIAYPRKRTVVKDSK